MKFKSWIGLYSIFATLTVFQANAAPAEGCDATAYGSSAKVVIGFPWPTPEGSFAFNCADINQAPVAGFTYTAEGNLLTQWSVAGEEQVDSVVISSFSFDDYYEYEGYYMPMLDSCVYHYAPGSSSDGGSLALTGVGAPPLDTSVTVTACSDGINTAGPEAPPEELLTTEKGKCQAEFWADPAGVADCTLDPRPAACERVDFIVATAYTETGAAVCTGTSDTQSGFAQRQCLNECVANNDRPDNCVAAADGSLPLECSACLPSDGSGVKYCWEWTDKVCSSTPGYENHGDCFDGSGGLARDLNTFIPSQTKENPSPGLSIKDGSTCYVQIVRLFGRVYAYTSCTGQIIDLGADTP